MIGKLLDGRYQIIQTLAAGGFGQTYLAQDTRRPGHPICVVKQLHPVSQDPQFLATARRLFTTEAETLERLGMHGQIPRLLAYFEQEAEFYLVQDYVEGHPLTQELVKGQRWEEGKVIQLLRELLEVLTFVHGQNVIHRDIKPDNILRSDGDGRLVLVDFGAVKQIRSQVALNPYGATNTVSVGTPGYMASEQARGQPCFASDLYSVGVIGIQALTGVSPQQFEYDSQTGEIVWQRDCCSPGLGAILERLVAYHFRERYQSAAEVLTVVSNLHVTAAPTAQLPAIAPPPPSPTVPPLSQQATLPVAPLEMSVHRVSPVKTARGGYSPAPKGKKPPHPVLLLFCSVFAVMFSVAFGATLALNRLQPQSGTANNGPRRSNPVLDWFGGREVSFERRPTCTVLVENGLNVRDRPNGQIVGGVERGTVLSLTGRKADNWVQINDPVEGWVSSQPQYVTCDQDFTAPVARESSPEPGSPPVASPVPERRVDQGGEVLRRAQEQFQNGDLAGAIELARSISRRSEAYRQAQNTMAQWQQEWQVLERRYEAARRALAERRWDDAIAHANTNPSEYEYWKTRFLQIAKEARDRKAEQQRNATPTRTTPRPSPSDMIEDSTASPLVEKPQKPEEQTGGWIISPPKPTPEETTPTFISPEPIIEPSAPPSTVTQPESSDSSFLEPF
ncbi:protein kinase [Spirulina subsalsa FACHB-351]|uniref:non-specific serine/threonine protein kinase n=1 Tax=Spirulina subsalsa FACHB-351 TaxID=234711 RepID=A0ABT3L982_9CYAN|nr:protein kinase [Spirulina subsalsa]MCW6038066.1 protein kinase [Spirulina subsalsa FACHB-351]